MKNCPYCVATKATPVGDNVTPIESNETLERVVVDLADFGAYVSPGEPRYLMSIVDHFSSYVRLYALFTKRKAEVWRAFLDFMCKEGVPAIVHSDNGGEFVWYGPRT